MHGKARFGAALSGSLAKADAAHKPNNCGPMSRIQTSGYGAVVVVAGGRPPPDPADGPTLVELNGLAPPMYGVVALELEG